MRDPPRVILAGVVLHWMMRSVALTSRWRLIGVGTAAELLAGPEPVILASWHDRNLLAVYGWLKLRPPGRRLALLASASRDGGLANWAVRGFRGVRCARGSSSRRGGLALKQLVRALRAGWDLGFTPDGPRGPPYQVQGGVILAAKLTGAPILPYIYQARRRHYLRTWDRMILPGLFNRIQVVYGEPLRVPPDAGPEALEQLRQELEGRLLALVEQAEHFS